MGSLLERINKKDAKKEKKRRKNMTFGERVEAAFSKKEVEEAPIPDDVVLDLANKRKAARRRAGGRAGTILTEGSTLG